MTNFETVLSRWNGYKFRYIIDPNLNQIKGIYTDVYITWTEYVTVELLNSIRELQSKHRTKRENQKQNKSYHKQKD